MPVLCNRQTADLATKILGLAHNSLAHYGLQVEGVDKQHLATESFNVDEEIEWDGQQQKNVHLGYKAENGFSLTVPHVNQHIGDVVLGTMFVGHLQS